MVTVSNSLADNLTKRAQIFHRNNDQIPTVPDFRRAVSKLNLDSQKLSFSCPASWYPRVGPEKNHQHYYPCVIITEIGKGYVPYMGVGGWLMKDRFKGLSRSVRGDMFSG